MIAEAYAGDHGEPSNNRVKLTKSAPWYDGGATLAAYAERRADVLHLASGEHHVQVDDNGHGIPSECELELLPHLAAFLHELTVLVGQIFAPARRMYSSCGFRVVGEQRDASVFGYETVLYEIALRGG